MIIGQTSPTTFSDVDAACGGIWTEGTLGELRELLNAALFVTQAVIKNPKTFTDVHFAKRDQEALLTAWRPYQDLPDNASSTAIADPAMKEICRLVGSIYRNAEAVDTAPVIHAREELLKVSLAIIGKKTGAMPKPGSSRILYFIAAGLGIAGVAAFIYVTRRKR
jgi:hypothetical protein